VGTGYLRLSWPWKSQACRFQGFKVKAGQPERESPYSGLEKKESYPVFLKGGCSTHSRKYLSTKEQKTYSLDEVYGRRPSVTEKRILRGGGELWGGGGWG